MFQVLQKQGKARLGVLHTAQGDVQTPAFMNVATAGAIKGGLSALDLQDIGCQVMLCNTYHLLLRPGDELIARRGGIGAFTGWQGPTLSDSGGFQVFSLAQRRKITEAGVQFQSHIDGRSIFMGPEESMRIQANLGTSVAMAFDECVANPAEYAYAKESCARTLRWLERSKKEFEIIRAEGKAVNPGQMLFGINQGTVFDDLRAAHMQSIAQLGLDGYAVGGLAVGESKEEMYHILEVVEPHMPPDKIRYLMGVGTPGNILQAVLRGIDLFDCVLPSRNARHGHLFTQEGIINLNNQRYAEEDAPVDTRCECPTCRHFSRAYIRHLLRAGEMLGKRLCVLHNLWFYNHLMETIRRQLQAGSFEAYAREHTHRLDCRI